MRKRFRRAYFLCDIGGKSGGGAETPAVLPAVAGLTGSEEPPRGGIHDAAARELERTVGRRMISHIVLCSLIFSLFTTSCTFFPSIRFSTRQQHKCVSIATLATSAVTSTATSTATYRHVTPLFIVGSRLHSTRQGRTNERLKVRPGAGTTLRPRLKTCTN